jgi:anti-anti-sigma factor
MPPPPPPFALQPDDSGQTTTLRFTTPPVRLDELNTQALAEEFLGLAERLAGHTLLLDFRDVDFVASSSLGLLLRLRQRLRAGGGRLRLCEVRPPVAEVFAVTRLDAVFGIGTDRHEAVPAPGGPESLATR